MTAVFQPQAEYDWPAQIKHLSPSFLKMLAKCPEQARRRYILGERIPPAAAMIQGRADHTAIEYNFRQKVDTFQDVPVADVQEVFAAEIDHEIDEAGGAAEIDFGKTVKGRRERRKAAGEMKDAGVRLVTAYHVQECPRFQPHTVEEEFSLELPGVPVPIEGRLDLVGVPKLPGFIPEGAAQFGPQVIRDRKTTGKTMRTPDSEWRVQAGVYMLHRWIPHEWHLSVKTKEPKIVTPEFEPGLVLKPSPLLKRQIVMQLRHLVSLVGFYFNEYGPDQPWDGAILHQWACDYCGFRPTCRWWKP